jgi:hypothetical protein
MPTTLDTAEKLNALRVASTNKGRLYLYNGASFVVLWQPPLLRVLTEYNWNQVDNVID